MKRHSLIVGVAVLAFAATIVSGHRRGGVAVTSFVPNVTSLPSNFPSPDTTGYGALSIGSQASGYSWSDTVTGVKTWKVTAAGTPASPGMFVPWYAQMGLAISQPWGPNLDQYHIAFINVQTGGGDGYVCDFGLSTSATPGPYNFRALPAANASYSTGTAAFSRKAGNPHIMYVNTSTALRLYNVATASFVDSSAASLGYSASWPSTGWTGMTGLKQWLMVNAAETWLTGNNGGAAPFISLNLTNGTVQTWSPSGVDDAYVGYGDFLTGDQQTQVWSLDTNTQVTYSQQFTAANGWSGSQPTSHLGILHGYWVAGGNTNAGPITSPMAVGTISQDGTATVVIGSQAGFPRNPKYWGQFHHSGNWWLQGSGTNQYLLQSNFYTPAGAPGPASEQYAITFINVWAGTGYRLGFSYSDYVTITGTGTNYWTQPHAHISHDGKLVIFGSDMLGTTRVDLFAIEVPLQAGTPPAFP